MLIGRTAEQEEIGRLVAGSRLGDSHVVVLTGEAGVGKTALLEDVVSGLAGFRLLRATGLETEQDIPFAGLLQLLGPALGALDSIPAPQAQALSTALALRPGTGGDRLAIGAATLSLICAYADDGPVAVVVDDLHLLDGPSAEALAFAARRMAADPVLLLLAGRTPEVDATVAGLPQTRVSGLDLEGARTLLSRTVDRPVPEDRVRDLFLTTAGNPLALIELGPGLDRLGGAAPGLPVSVPAAVTGAFSRRLRLLDEAARAVLLVAAVSGGDLRVASDACRHLGLDVTRLGDAADEALVTVQDGRIDFRHPLLRAAAYSDASAADRRAAHLAVAHVLPEAETDRRTWHLSEATWAPDPKVADLLVRAGEHAAARAAYSVASTAYERASRLSPAPEHRAERLFHAADTAWSAGLARRALSLLADLRPLTADPARRARALRLEASIAASAGALREAGDMLVDAADLARTPDDEILPLADAVLASFYLGDVARSTRLAERLTPLVASATSPRARALGLMAAGMAGVLAGRGGAAQIRDAVPLLEGTPALREDPRSLPWLLLGLLFLRDSHGGSALRVEGVRDRAGVDMLPSVLFLLGRDQATTDSWTLAAATYAEAIRLAQETGQTTQRAMSLAGLCWLESRMGEEVGSRQHAREVLDLCADRSIHLGEVWALFAQADLELSLGDAAAAVEQCHRLTELLDYQGLDDVDLAPLPELTDALLRLGRVEDARACATTYSVAARAKGQPWALARAERAAGLTASDDGFDRHFERALDLHEQTRDRFEVGRTRLAYGERLRRAGRRVDARSHLREALAVFTDLGATAWAGRAAVELAATGESVHRRATTWRPALTPQELQVSLQLTAGRTTREAAGALFLSPKTVEYHLRKIYAKFGIHTRTELAAVVADLTGPPR